MKQPNQKKDELQWEYEIIFQHLNSALDAPEFELVGHESAEINELRKIIVELSEPDLFYATSSDGVGEYLPNASLVYSA